MKVTEGESWLVVARLVWPDGAYLDTSTTGSDGIVDVTLRVYDLDSATPATSIYSPANIAVGACLYSPLQTDGYWTTDNTGYNFRHLIANTAFERDGGHRYVAEYTFNPHASNVYGPRVARFYFEVDPVTST